MKTTGQRKKSFQKNLENENNENKKTKKKQNQNQKIKTLNKN